VARPRRWRLIGHASAFGCFADVPRAMAGRPILTDGVEKGLVIVGKL